MDNSVQTGGFTTFTCFRIRTCQSKIWKWNLKTFQVTKFAEFRWGTILPMNLTLCTDELENLVDWNQKTYFGTISRKLFFWLTRLVWLDEKSSRFRILISRTKAIRYQSARSLWAPEIWMCVLGKFGSKRENHLQKDWLRDCSVMNFGQEIA